MVVAAVETLPLPEIHNARGGTVLVAAPGLLSEVEWYEPITLVLAPMILVWFLLVGWSVAANALRRGAFAVTSLDNRWVDVSKEAKLFQYLTRRVRTGRVIRVIGIGMLIWAAILMYGSVPSPTLWVAIAIAVFLVWRSAPYLAFLATVILAIRLAFDPDSRYWQALLMFAGAVWIYIGGTRSAKRIFPKYRQEIHNIPVMDDWLRGPHLTWNARRVWALAASGAVSVGFLVTLYTYVAAKWAAMAPGSPGLPLGPLKAWHVLVAVLADRFLLAETFLVATVTGLYLLNGLALRLWTPHLWEVMPTRSPSAIVYLRNFDDDKELIPAGAQTRVPLFQMIFDVLVPVRRRRFEEVLVGMLRHFDEVIAAADPRRSYQYGGGALKASLSHDTWQRDVRNWCSSAKAIVVSATPTEIHDGLREELSIISTLEHERIILVLGPGNPSEVGPRFAAFRAAFPPDSKLLNGLNDDRVAPGTLVMVRVPGRGWDCWGAQWRTESAYAVALDQAMKHGRTVWGLETEDDAPPRTVTR